MVYQVTGLALLLLAAPALPQQVTGVPGSPSATATINGQQLPPPPPKFGGVINAMPPSPSPGGRPGWCHPRARPTFYLS